MALLAGSLDGVHYFLGGFVAAHVVHDDIGAGLPHGDGYGFADPGVGPRHQCFLPLEKRGRHAILRQLSLRIFLRICWQV